MIRSLAAVGKKRGDSNGEEVTKWADRITPAVIQEVDSGTRPPPPD